MTTKTKPSEAARARAAASLDATIAEHKANAAPNNIPPGNIIPAPAKAPHTQRPAGGLDEDIARVHPSDFNPRRTFSDDSLAELAESLKTHGMLEPIVVRPVPAYHPAYQGEHIDARHYQILAGERRYRAAKIAGLHKIPIRILHDVDDKTALELCILENLQRVDLDPIEEARGYAMLRDQAGMTQSQIGEAVKRSQPVIAKALGLLRLPDDVLEHIQHGRLTASHGQVLAKFSDFPKLVQAIAKVVVERHWTTRQLEDNPLPDTWSLGEANIIRPLRDAAFDTTVICNDCPFGARYSPGGSEMWGQYCLKPDHFDELQKAAKAEQQRAVNTAVQAAKRDGAGVVKLKNLSYQQWHDRSYDVPAGCSDACPCAVQGLDNSGGMRPICTDPKRYDALKAAEAKAEKATKRAAVKTNLASLSSHIAAVEAITPEMLAALLAPALRSVSKPAWQAAVEQHVPGLLGDKDKLTAQELATLTPLDLVRFALQAVIGHELLASIEENWRTTDTWKYYMQYLTGVAKNMEAV